MTTQKPMPHALSVSCRMLTKSDTESVTTDLSLFSVSSAADSFGKHRLVTFKEYRGPSPNPDQKANRSEIMWFEEGNDLIRSCAALSKALGIQKSFSTSDITQLPGPETEGTNQLRHTVSELALNSLQRCGYMLDNPSRLEHASRSCSTWVAVGELASTSQLPSPHGGPASTSQLTTSTPPPAFTAADLIRSVNKKVRQNYIRRRLLTTYRALDRLSQSEFNLDRLEAVAASYYKGPGPTELIVPSTIAKTTNNNNNTSTANPNVPNDTHTEPAQVSKKQQQINADIIKKKISLNMTKNLTIQDIEKERGKPLSKYDRNMMIFNWLHTLDEVVADEDVS
ncbi:uncharacterized protein LOC119078261 isoform X2 [Bradysia coprophila]|uniref:uncharacterized protein LOC119078261 isoform X2 n=1 Tax=Bradysia coprophila TaxID=38358 RepID=UPI00187DB2FF|nr:uncharacterized protein LOC119078261 isoform X2 [Bradysia coprophila]